MNGGRQYYSPEGVTVLKQALSRGGKFFLFDTWESAWPDHLLPTLDMLQSQDVTPVMAHPERCPFVLEDPLDVAERLAELGVLFQLNSFILADNSDLPEGMTVTPAMRQCALRLLEFDYYSFVATDTHRAWQVEARLAGLDALRRLVGERTFHRLAVRNPEQLLPPDAT